MNPKETLQKAYESVYSEVPGGVAYVLQVTLQ